MKYRCYTDDTLINMNRQHKIKWTLYITIASIFIFVSVSEVGPFTSMKKSVFSSLIQEPQKYVIVFDGGSTGTRIHVFAFLNNSGGFITLKNEYFQEVKPGLSSFADKPENAADSVATLLERAKSSVPTNSWDDTPVALKATAGLRLLPSHLSDSILEEISEILKKSPFHSDEKSVSVLDGEDEGLYAWYTINFLLGRLSKAIRSVASLDLGGGSTQVTFAPVDLDTIVFSPKGYIVRRKVQNKMMSIYTHSYLGLGLMSARLSILRLSSEKLGKHTNLSSSCVHPRAKISWKHASKDYTIVGKKEGTYGFDYCYGKAVNFLDDSVDISEELWKKEIYGLSYYFDRAVDLGLIGKEGGFVTVGEYMQASKEICNNKTPGKPFLCLDSCYITALLHHGLGFDIKKEIKLVSQIDGIETSWALGAAFNML